MMCSCDGIEVLLYLCVVDCVGGGVGGGEGGGSLR